MTDSTQPRGGSFGRASVGAAVTIDPIRMEVPLASLAPGEYECQLTVVDPATQRSAIWRQTVHVVQ